MKKITDKEFKYVPAIDTSVRKTFERIRREHQKRKDVCESCAPWFDNSSFTFDWLENVRPLKKAK